MSDTLNTDDKFSFRISYPWYSLFVSLLVLFYALLMSSPALVEILHIPALLFSPYYFIGAFLFFLLVAWIDVKRFSRQQKKVRASMQQLWGSKRHLQQRAQTSASHTDKLKLFISDKLLEYIEYDEKYLHFKSIAAEVRHNGVISFDKVQSALNYAKDHSLPGDGEDTAVLYQEALVGMRYLWDLLDLSTTDNMALHIGANVSRCEELLFQAELQGTELNQLPMPPSFSPLQALLDTLALHLGVTLNDVQGIPYRVSLPDKGANENDVNTLILTDSDGLYRIELAPCDDLLGNPNHLILLLENLLKNAQFFATKRQYKSDFAPISIRIWESRQCLCLTIYNRGPHISAEAGEQIFQLGFSTRRVQEHHGKGLGLYFVQQITQGFDGDIGFDNVHTPSCQYHLRLEQAGGEVQNLNLNITVDDGVPQVRQVGDNEPAQKQWSITLAKRLTSLEIDIPGEPGVQRFEFDGSRQTLFDPKHPAYPHWMLKTGGRKGEQVSFVPLDIRGVQFSVRLPTASGRIDGVMVSAAEPELDELEASFRSPDDF